MILKPDFGIRNGYFEETVPQIEEEIDEEIIEPEPIETESFVDKDDYNEFLEAIKSS